MPALNHSKLREALGSSLGQVLTPELAARIECLAIEREPKGPGEDFLTYCMRGNRDAVTFVTDIIRVADVWDNLIDGDQSVTNRQVDDMVQTLLFSVHKNEFFAVNAPALMPIMQVSIINWQIANAMSRDDRDSRIQSHVLRYAPIDIIVASAAICGGEDWAVEIGPKIRRFHMTDTLDAYLQELAERDERETAATAPLTDARKQ